MHRLPRWCSGNESAFQCRSCRRCGFNPGSGRFPGEGNGNPFQYSCLDKNGQRSLLGYSPWGHKESDMTEQFTHTHTYTHSSPTYYDFDVFFYIFMFILPLFIVVIFTFTEIFLICVLVYLSDFLYNCDFLLSIDSYVFSI